MSTNFTAFLDIKHILLEYYDERQIRDISISADLNYSRYEWDKNDVNPKEQIRIEWKTADETRQHLTAENLAAGVALVREWFVKHGHEPVVRVDPFASPFEGILDRPKETEAA